MNYRIMRGIQEYGPYTLTDLQRYVASGNISPDDLTRSDASQDWVPVSQVIGNIPLPAPAPPIAAVRPRQWDLKRDNDKLVVRRGAKLPPNCVKCGQHTDKPGLEKTFYWASPWYALLILAGLIVYAIVVLIVRKKMGLIIPLCDEHRSDRKKKLFIGGLLLVASLILFLFGVSNTEALAALGILGCLVALIAGIMVLTRSVPLRPKKIDDLEGVFVGAGEPFLKIVESGPTPLANVAGMY